MEENLLKWSEEYAFGLPDIDFEHKQLFNNINNIIELKDLGPGLEIAVQVHLEFLVKYVDQHFKAEEEMFDQTDYPHKEEHKRAHEALKNTVFQFQERILKGDTQALDDFIPVAKNWLVNHINKVDRAYVEYCQAKNIGVKSKLDFA